MRLYTLAAARRLQSAAQVQGPLEAVDITVLDAPIDLFALYAETRELGNAVTELRRQAMIYRVIVDKLSAQSAEMKDATRTTQRSGVPSAASHRRKNRV